MTQFPEWAALDWLTLSSKRVCVFCTNLEHCRVISELFWWNVNSLLNNPNVTGRFLWVGDIDISTFTLPSPQQEPPIHHQKRIVFTDKITESDLIGVSVLVLNGVHPSLLLELCEGFSGVVFARLASGKSFIKGHWNCKTVTCSTDNETVQLESEDRGLRLTRCTPLHVLSYLDKMLCHNEPCK